MELQNNAVSVVIPAFNAAPFLAKALDSVLAQTHQPFEVIVVDDGSEDETPEIVRAYGDCVRSIRITHCGRPGRVRNHGILAANGKYVAFLDSDDVSVPGRFERQLGLIKSTESDLAVCDCLEFSSGGASRTSFLERIGAKTYLQSCLHNSVVANAFDVMLEIGGFIPPSAAMVLRKTILDLGLFPEHLECGEDLELFLRLAIRGRIALDLAPLTLRRLHVGNISRDRRRVVSDGLLICQDLAQHDLIAGHPRWANLVRRAKARWYREQGSLFLREGEHLAARRSWEQCFRLAPSFRLGVYWLMSFVPAPWLKTSLALKERYSGGSVW